MNPELAQYEALAKDILRRVMAEEEAVDLHQWLMGMIAHIGGAGAEDAVMDWPASLDYTDAMLAKFAQIAALPADQRKLLDWPWASWNSRIDPLEDGMLAVITAPDGQGKTIIVECIAEHWAKTGQRVVFVHYELNRTLMMLRRLARHTSITPRDLKGGHLSGEQQAYVAAVRPKLTAWDGAISYVHTPGWSMERTTAELRRLHNEGLCDVVVLDYLEKAQPSKRQASLHMDWYQREADNVEQLKTFAEASDIPVLMVAQMSKAGKGQSADNVDRNAMTGAADKSNRSNLVVLLKRARSGDGYSNTVDVIIDKNTMGPTGSFTQYMQPEYFRIGDITEA